MKVIGVMSGTSVDGLDLAFCDFKEDNSGMKWEILKSTTFNYPEKLRVKLMSSTSIKSEELCKLDFELGEFIGRNCNTFILKNKLNPELIASHGHTVFHQPKSGFTHQIGNGAAIAFFSGCRTACDFRSIDVVKGGQGAPLVPIGDEYLFSDFDSCVNIGGFSNISISKRGKRIAYDICPANIVLNHFAEKYRQSFDINGEIGRRGNINSKLLEKLNEFSFYKEKAPKSLGKEWVEKYFQPVLDDYEIPDLDKFRTVYEHISTIISLELNDNNCKTALFTGGGVHNSFLISLIKQKTNSIISIPSLQIIDFKEALVFAFLGFLRSGLQRNILSDATGATEDSIAGAIYEP